MVVLIAGCTGQGSTEASCVFNETMLWSTGGGLSAHPSVTTDDECDAACLVNFKKEHGEPTGKMNYGSYGDVADGLGQVSVECMCWVCPAQTGPTGAMIAKPSQEEVVTPSQTEQPTYQGFVWKLFPNGTPNCDDGRSDTRDWYDPVYDNCKSVVISVK